MRLTTMAIGTALLAGCASSDGGGSPATGGVYGTGGMGGGLAGNGGTSSAGGAGGTTSSGGLGSGGLGSGGLSAGGAGGMASGGAGGAASGGAGGSASGGSGGGGPEGCGKNLLPLPDDPSVRGPWEVGVRTVKAGRVTAEIMYPAEPGSTVGKPEAKYDIRDWLPPRERPKVPDDASPQVGPIGGKLFRDVPIDAVHGPYPVVVMIHGTASFRIATGSTNVHWASHGFVVIAADYPGLGLADQLSATLECGLPQSGAQDLPGDVRAQIAAIDAGAGDFAFLNKRADAKRVALAGHSQGACIAATLAGEPNVQVVLPFAGSTAAAQSSSLKSLMWVSGIQDTVIGFSTANFGNVVCPNATSNVGAYEASAGPPQVKKRIAGINGGGHLVPTDLCQKNQYDRNAIQEAQKDGVCGINSAVIIGLPALFDCGTIEMPVGINALNYASTAALEETLHCQDRTQAFRDIKTKVPAITDFREKI